MIFINTSAPKGTYHRIRSSHSIKKSVPPTVFPQFFYGLPSRLNALCPFIRGRRIFFAEAKQSFLNRQLPTKEIQMQANEEQIRKALIDYWKEEVRKEQISEDTTSMNPEFCMYLNELYSNEPISEFQLSTYKEITNK